MASVVQVAKALLVISGFVAGLIGSGAHTNAHELMMTVVGAIVGVLVLPLMMELMFRFHVLAGYFKPPWEAPTWSGKMTWLSLFQLFSFVFFAMGLGASISIAWNGIVSLQIALMGFSGAIGVHRGIARLLKRYPPVQP
jgi:hypothetical protein